MVPPVALVATLNRGERLRSWCERNVVMRLERPGVVARMLTLVTVVCLLLAGCSAETGAPGAHLRPPGITDATIQKMTFPTGTCGNSSFGWMNTVPITVQNGKGEARTASGQFGGASIQNAKLVGWVDVAPGSVEDAVVSFTCFGSTFADCCAGRSSMMMFVRVFDFSNPSSPTSIGDTIMPGISKDRRPGHDGEGRGITSVRVDGSTIITEEKLIYPDTSGAEADLGYPPDSTIEVTHRFVDGQWVSTEHLQGANANSGSGGGGGFYTRCGSAPVFTPQKFRTATGGLVVTLKVTATCPGGDVLGASGTSITLHDDAGMIASGTFDFSANPIGIAPGSGSVSGNDGTVVDLTFPPGSFWRLPDTLGTDSAGTDSSAGAAAKAGILVECQRPDGGASQASASQSSAATASSGFTPTGTNIGSNCSQALRSQTDSDRAFITAQLNGHWLAQLSSKQPGLVADGKTWDECAILNEFLTLRLRFKDVRMLWSDEWSVFSVKGWWVTVAAATFPGPDEANAWCSQNGFDNEHCFAKLISTSAGPDGSTRYWH